MKKKLVKIVKVQDNGVQLHVNIPKDFTDDLKLKKGDFALMTLSDKTIKMQFNDIKIGG